PYAVVVGKPSPEALVIAAVPEVTEKGIHVFQFPGLGSGFQYAEPSIPASGNQMIKRVFIPGKQFLLFKDDGVVSVQLRNIPFQRRHSRDFYRTTFIR